MAKKAFLVLICFIGLIIFVSTLHGQGSKKTITLPSGEVVCDLNGEWDVFVKNYGPWASFSSYPQMWKITQTGSSFVAVRMIKDYLHEKGSPAAQGELDKCNMKKVTILTGGPSITAKGRISDHGNKIVIDDGRMVRVTATRK
jgi:hypothetical protein